MVNPPPIQLATIGWADSLILMVLALVVFGPRRLPQIGKQIGKLMYEFRKASNDFKFQMEEELRLSEDADRRKKAEEERLRNLALKAPDATVESQAGVGAMESVSAPAPASPYPGEGAYPVQYPADGASPTAGIPYPRISPPSTGEQVAARQGSGGRGQGSDALGPETQSPGDQGTASEGGVVAEASVGGDEPAEGKASESPTAPENTAEAASDAPVSHPASDGTRTEPVSQHG